MLLTCIYSPAVSYCLVYITAIRCIASQVMLNAVQNLEMGHVTLTTPISGMIYRRQA